MSSAEKSPLEILIGTGYLSVYEAANLESGQLIQMTTKVGQPCQIVYSGHVIGHGEVVIAKDRLLIRLLQLNSGHHSAAYGGVSEQLFNILPVRLLLARLAFSIDELLGLTIGSFIALEQDFNLAEDASLYFFDQEYAKGKIISIYDCYGLRITQVLKKWAGATLAQSSGSVFEKTLPNLQCQTLNFKTPDLFSQQQILAMTKVAQAFLKNLGIDNLAVIKVRQRTLRELRPEIEHDFNYTIVHNQAYPQFTPRFAKFTENEIKSKNLKMLLQIEDSKYTFPSDLLEQIEKVWANKEANTHESLMLIAQHRQCKNLPLKNIIAALNTSFKVIANADFILKEETSDYKKSAIFHGNELGLEINFGLSEKVELMLFYPFVTLQPYWSKLG